MTDKHELTPEQRELFADLQKRGCDPISVLADILADERAPMKVRKDAAKSLRPYYHRRLAEVGPLFEEFGE